MPRYQEFKAVTYLVGTNKKVAESQVNIGSYNDEQGTMAIHTTGKAVVHITREQAMEFFGLVIPLMF